MNLSGISRETSREGGREGGREGERERGRGQNLVRNLQQISFQPQKLWKAQDLTTKHLKASRRNPIHWTTKQQTEAIEEVLLEYKRIPEYKRRNHCWGLISSFDVVADRNSSKPNTISCQVVS